MSKRTMAADGNVELFERDIPEVLVEGEPVDVQIELVIGDWPYEAVYKTRDGVESMIEGIDELSASLDTIRAALFDHWTGTGE